MQRKIQNPFAYILSVFLVAPYPMSAAPCDGNMLLKCNLAMGSFTVCLKKSDVSVEIHDTTTSDIHYSTSIDDAALQPWTGLGRYRTTVLRLEDGSNRVDVFSSFDTRAGDGLWQAGMNSYKSGSFVAQSICQNSQSSDWLDPVETAKMARGWCWDLEDERWTKVCG